jgi:hypothetical protein
MWAVEKIGGVEKNKLLICRVTEKILDKLSGTAIRVP